MSVEVTHPKGLLRDSPTVGSKYKDEIEVREQVGMERSERSAAARMVPTPFQAPRTEVANC